MLQLQPENMEEFIDYLIENKRLDEAAQRLEEIINKTDFISKVGKSKHQVWFDSMNDDYLYWLFLFCFSLNHQN